MAPLRLNFITGNQNKLLEVQAILKNVVEVSNVRLDLPEIQGSLEDVTREKCRRAADEIQGPVLVEDTGLCFKALQDLPGPYMSFLNALGHDGLNKMLAGFDDKSAEAVSTFGYCNGPGRPIVLFEGRSQGRIVPARGPPKFGWDPIFEYGDSGKTFAEMDGEEKNEISHRRKALDKLRNWLESSA